MDILYMSLFYENLSSFIPIQTKNKACTGIYGFFNYLASPAPQAVPQAAGFSSGL